MIAYVDKIIYSQIWASPNLYRSNSKPGCLNYCSELPPAQEDGTGESGPLSVIAPCLYAYSFEVLNVPEVKQRSFSPRQKLLQ